MNFFKNEDSFKSNISNIDIKNHQSSSFYKSRLLHKTFDSINFSLLILISILSFISFDSQKKWTSTYKILAKTRTHNINLIDYISKTEEKYIDEFESIQNFKKTTPSDLIYLDKKITKIGKKNLSEKIKYIQKGLIDSNFSKGY